MNRQHGYRDSVEWIALSADGTYWAQRDELLKTPLIRFLAWQFRVTPDRVVDDVIRYRERQAAQDAADSAKAMRHIDGIGKDQR